MDIGCSEAEAFWTAFLRKVPRPRALMGVEDHQRDASQVKAVAKLNGIQQSCRANKDLAHAGKSGRRVVSAIATGCRPAPSQTAPSSLTFIIEAMLA
ncbi:hypothetical protein IVB12_24325 [Bradyrhizobium sp. 179]|nr:hypothetical protein [Bradyrhizobium sp. 179]